MILGCLFETEKSVPVNLNEKKTSPKSQPKRNWEIEQEKKRQVRNLNLNETGKSNKRRKDKPEIST